MSTTVTALLVSHDGARWLPSVLDGLERQSRAPDHVVCVDTGSTDATSDLLSRRLGAEATHCLPPTTGYGQAVAEALSRLPAAERPEWVWLLHDDSAPEPDALARLLEAATAHPGADVLGPQLREWPSSRRLLEVGVTLSGTGRRETGLERGEYDQGQHHRDTDVLAVNTAGMLVRREVLESLGLDPALQIFGNDVDFGWRAARAGHRTMVVPSAVVFHAEAASRGVRRTRLTGRRPRRGEREAALYTLLANAPAATLPLRWLRLLLGSLLRALALMLARAPGEAADELMALGSVYARPWRVLVARRSRRRTATVAHRDVRHLLAPPWVPYRHGLDRLVEAGTALRHQASGAVAARQSATVSGSTVGVLALLVLASLWSARGLLGAGVLSGGALLPAPDTATHWWRTYLASVHDLGTGSDAPAAPYLLPLAVAGSLLLGKAWLVIDVLMLLCVPLAALGARRLLLRVTGSAPAALWGAVGYGLLPVLTGAVQQGRLGTVAVAVVLPWLVHAAMFLDVAQTSDRRRRAAWRTSLWLALTASFAPLVWLLASAVAVSAVLVGAMSDPRWRRPAAGGLVLLPLLVAPVLLVPWSVLTWTGQGPVSWLTEAGLSAPGLLAPLGWTDVVAGRLAGSAPSTTSVGGAGGAAGAPWWLAIGVVLAAVAALARRDRRRAVLSAWLVVLVALGTVAALGGQQVALAREPVPHLLWTGVPLLVAQGALVCACASAGAGIRDRLTGSSFGWRQPVGAVVVVLALLSPPAALVWWSLAGSAGPLERTPPETVPAYMADASAGDPASGVLVVRGGVRRGLSHVLQRGISLRVGDDSVLPSARQQQPLSDLVARLAAAPQLEDVAALRGYGVGFVYAPAPADAALASSLDSVSGLTQASADRPGARAWQVDPTTTGPGTDILATQRETSSARPWLLAVQGAAWLVVAVLAAPTRRAPR